MELAKTRTRIAVPEVARPHDDVDVVATIDVPHTDLRLEIPHGTVTFRANDHVACHDVPVDSVTASCPVSDVSPGRLHLTADFAPVDGSTLHPSAVRATVLVGTEPVISAPRRVRVRVGEPVKITLRASGAPAPLLRQVGRHLPAGLTFHQGHGKATITGSAKRSGVGTHRVRVKAVNLLRKDLHRLALVVERR